MTQVGYLENLNPWTNGGEALEDAEPVVAHSPSTSVMYGNNSMWTSTIGPIKHAEYIALAYDAVLFQAAPNKNSMKGCPMAYNASNATVWQPNTGYQPLRWHGGPLRGHDRRHYLLHLPNIDPPSVQRTRRRPVRLQPGQRYHLPHLQSKRPGANGRRHWSNHLLHITYLFAIIRR